MTIQLQLPPKTHLKPMITVFGVGGAGGNAVNNMINSSLDGVQFVVANTDAQALENALAENKIQLGETITQGLGAGSYPEVGKASAEESAQEILEHLRGCNMVFIAAGMGGGTGTGAAPVVARIAREQGILTVGVVTKPFHFEGTHRMRVAELGLQELQKYVDTLIVIPNQNLFRVADKNTTFQDAFKLADQVLHSGIRGITDLMIMPGLINLDFADIRSVMGEMGKAMMGTGEAAGDKRATEAAEEAISNPLLDNVSMKGARGVLINITGGPDLTLFEVDEAANRVREEVDPEANIIFGSAFDQNMEGKIRVSVVATGIEGSASQFDMTGAESKSRKSSTFQREEEQETPSKSNFFSRISASTQAESDEDEEEEVEEQPAQRKARAGGFQPLRPENPKPSYGKTGNVFVAPEPLEPKVSKTYNPVAGLAEQDPFGKGSAFDNAKNQYAKESALRSSNRSGAQEKGKEADSAGKPGFFTLFGGRKDITGFSPEAEEQRERSVQKEEETSSEEFVFETASATKAGRARAQQAKEKAKAKEPVKAKELEKESSLLLEEELDIPAFLRRGRQN